MSWPLVKLSDVALINPRLPKEHDEGQLVSFVAMASTSEEGHLIDSEERILSETRKGFTYFERKDVLLAKITPCFENGKCLRPGEIDHQIGFGSTEFHVIRPVEEKLDGLYLFYMVWNQKFRFLGEQSMSGAAGQKRVGADFLKNFEIPLPPLAEQKRIAAILDKADAIRRKRQQAIQLADELLRSVFLDMFGDPIANPKGFPTKKIGDILTIKNGYAFKSEYFTDNGDQVLLTPGNFFEKGGYKDRGPKQKYYKGPSSDDFILEGGEVLIAMTEQAAGLLGSSMIVPQDKTYLHNQRLGLLKYDKELVNQVYLAQLFNNSSVRKTIHASATGIKVRHTSPHKIEDIDIGYPDLDSQIKFSGIVERLNRKQEQERIFEASSDVLFSSLSQKAFSGQL